MDDLKGIPGVCGIRVSSRGKYYWIDEIGLATGPYDTLVEASVGYNSYLLSINKKEGSNVPQIRLKDLLR